MGEDLENLKVFINGVEFKGVKNVDFEKVDVDHHKPKIYNSGYSMTGELIISKRFKKKLIRKLKWFRFKYKIKNMFKL